MACFGRSWRQSHRRSSGDFHILVCLKLFFQSPYLKTRFQSRQRTPHTMPNSLYMPDSHFIDAISVHASVHHHLGLCLPHERRGLALVNYPAFNDNNAISTDDIVPNYACSARVLVLVCLCSRACARVLVLVVLVLSCYCARVLVFSGVLVRPVPSVPSVPSPLTVPPVPGVAHALRGWWAGRARVGDIHLGGSCRNF